MPIKPGKYDPLKPDIELFDFKSKKRYGLKLEGSGALRIGTISQDDTVHVRAAGKRVGDFDEQRSWKGGRGFENLSDNPEGFWDSQNAWTMSAGRVHQTLLYQHARGLRSADFYLPSKTRSMTWVPLLSSTLYLSTSWSSMGFTASFARLWIRRVGSPGTLTVKLHSNSAGNPGTVLATATVTTSDITDFVSVFPDFSLASQVLSAATTYHISVYGASTDNKSNHWEVGGYSGGSTGKMSTDGSSWSSASFDPYYYVGDAAVSRTFFPFFLDEAMYVVDKKDTGSNSQLYINGDRGLTTSSGSTTLTDTARSWTSDRWVGAFVKIVKGTGVGQVRTISANSATQLTVSVAWYVNPSTDSEYIIYGTEWWTEITGHGLTIVTSKPCVSNNIVYFPQGSGTNIRRMIWTGSAYAYSDDGTNKANHLEKVFSPGGTAIYRAVNNSTQKEVSAASHASWANPPTALSFGDAKHIGSNSYDITSLQQKDSLLYIFKPDGVWNMDKGGNLAALQSGIEKTPSSSTGLGSIVHQQFAYFSWMHSVIRIYGSNFDDIGQDWSGKGLPDGREGFFSSMDAYTSLLMCGVDALSGTSSVLGFDGIGWHELFRAWDSNLRVRMVKVQPCDSTRNRTWIDVGGDLVYQEMPFMKGSPRLDAGCRYQHEAVIESAAIDMGTASGLPKFIKELTVFCENLGGYNDIAVDYQVDDSVGTTTWTPATTIYESPESTAYLGLDNIRKFAYRLRIRSSDNTSPVMVLGVTPNGYARVPFKMVWTLRCRADNITSRGRLVKPDELMRWLLDSSRFPGRVLMLSQYELAHKFSVVIHPPQMFPYKPAAAGQAEESILTLVLEEA